MADIRVFVLLVLSYICVKCAPLTGKALLCRDPDTGKLYPINATWISSTFCGNYTCSLRKQNISLSEPIRQINISNTPDLKTLSVITLSRKTEPNHHSLLQKTNLPQNIALNEEIAAKKFNVRKPSLLKISKKAENITNIINENELKSPNDDDRLLTEEEINHISEVLHTIKKSDLDAFVEIYDIAQEIIKEMEKATDNALVEEAINLIKEEDSHKNSDLKYSSYWYDPLANKAREVDRYDLNQKHLITVPSVVKSQEKVQSYFSGILSSDEIGKMPYYYPVTSFQRLSSYTYPLYYPTRKPLTDNTIEKNKKPCTGQRKQEKEKLIQTSRLLPYPFTNIHGLNTSDYHTKSKTVYNNNAWAMNFHSKNNNYVSHFNAFIPVIPKAILINPYLSEVQDIEQPIYIPSKPSKNPVKQKHSLLREMHTQSNKKPEWKTEQLSLDILEDIRAHIDTSRMLKPFPWRKKLMKLENVEKNSKTDTLKVAVDRHRRSLNGTNKIKRNATNEVTEISVTKNEEKRASYNLGEFEAFLDTVRCEPQTEPGFFRMGNMSQPYPACCPELVNKTR